MLLMGNTIELYINDELVFNSSLHKFGQLFAESVFANDGTLDVLNLEIIQVGRIRFYELKTYLYEENFSFICFEHIVLFVFYGQQNNFLRDTMGCYPGSFE